MIKRDKFKVFEYFECMKVKGIVFIVYMFKFFVDIYVILDFVDMEVVEFVFEMIKVIGQKFEVVYYVSFIYVCGCVFYDFEGVCCVFDVVVKEFLVFFVFCLFQVFFEVMVVNYWVVEIEFVFVMMWLNCVEMIFYIVNIFIYGWVVEKNIVKVKEIYVIVSVIKWEFSIYEVMICVFFVVEECESVKGVVIEMFGCGYLSVVVNKVLEFFGGGGNVVLVEVVVVVV